jgi:O-antigen/teichoic acid export membrane protein
LADLQQVYSSSIQIESNPSVPRQRLKSRLTSAFSITGISSLVNIGLTTIALLSIARNSGPSGYAMYVAANMIVFGLPLALANYAAREDGKSSRYHMAGTCTTAVLIFLGFSVLISVVISSNISYIETYLNIGLGPTFQLFFPFLLLCTIVSDCTQGIYSGLLRLRTVFLITTCGSLSMVLYVQLRRAGVDLPVWGAVAASYITSSLIGIICLLKDGLIARPAPISAIRPILKDLIPGSTFTYFQVFSTWTDRWIVGTQLGSLPMGSYSAATLVIQGVLRVPSHIAYTLVPASARVSISEQDHKHYFHNRLINLYASFSIFLVVIIMLAPSTLISSLFGKGFRDSVPALFIMAPSLLASAVSIPYISMLTGSIKNRLVTYLLVFTVPVRITLLLLFTREWSYLGTALATTLAEFFLAFSCIVLGRQANIRLPLGALIGPYVHGIIAFLCGLLALLAGASQIFAIGVAFLVFLPRIIAIALYIARVMRSYMGRELTSVDT